MKVIDPARPRVDWLALWVLFSSWCVLLGWALSLLGCLDRAGYLAGFILFGVALKCLGRDLGVWRKTLSRSGLRPWRGRFLLPKFWLVLAILITAGGLLYHPANYDYLTYRFPRLLHWWWEKGWFWIPTANPRMNYSGTGFEWLMMPLFVFFQTDRLFFLINLFSWLLLPGLVFRVFRQLGVSSRASWWWMWVLPCGYCYALQAGSAGNDSFAAVYLLASIYYALRADSMRPADLLLSALSVALLTGAKAANLPLVLPWVIALWINRANLLLPFRPGWWAGTLLLSVGVSFLPLALLNIHFTGDYSGDPDNRTRMKLVHPMTGIIGNAVEIVASNLAPPVWPKKIDWAPLIPSGLARQLEQDFPRLTTGVGEMQIEESAGAGIGVVLLTAMTLAFGLWAKIFCPRVVVAGKRQARWIAVGAVVALLFYMGKIGSEAASRLVAAYYPLLIAGGLVAIPLNGIIIHRRLYQIVGLGAVLSVFPLIILDPARPLFPVSLVENQLVRLHAPASLTNRFDQVYGVYASRVDPFASLMTAIPRTETTLGIVQNGNAAEASLWQPFGSRQVNDVDVGATREELAQKNIHFVLVSDDALHSYEHLTCQDLMRRWSATLVLQTQLDILAQRGPETWYILRL